MYFNIASNLQLNFIQWKLSGLRKLLGSTETSAYWLMNKCNFVIWTFLINDKTNELSLIQVFNLCFTFMYLKEF